MEFPARFAPNRVEYTADTDSLRVVGEIPRDLHVPMGICHPFDGDGMLHAIYFENDRATVS